MGGRLYLIIHVHHKWEEIRMNAVPPLEAGAHYTCSDPAQFNFETTNDLPDLLENLGQPRAIEAVSFGIGMEQAAKRALASAGNLLENQEGFLVVIILVPGAEEARRLQSEVGEFVRRYNLHVHCRWVARGMK